MPLQFACEHCHQRLSVSAKKAGTKSRCPKCDQTILVPAARTPSGGREDDSAALDHSALDHSARGHSAGDRSARGQSANDDSAVREIGAARGDSPDRNDPNRDDPDGNDPDGDNPYAQFAVFDGPTEWSYADESDSQPAVSVPDSHKVAIPRKVIYLQGILLGLVAVGCFAAGVMVGSNAAGSRQDAAQGPTPCILSGQVTYRDRDGELLADAGAVVIALPRDARPDQRAVVEGLRVSDPQPADGHAGIQIIRQIGGNYIRADQEGKFQLRLPDSGQYFVLFLSRNRPRSAGQLNRKDLAQIGRYFDPATELLGNSDYRWSEVLVMRKDRAVDHVFQ